MHIGKESTLRGAVLARKIKVEKGTVVSREETFVKESDPAKVVEEQGIKFVVNEIVVLFADNATFADVQAVAELVSGTITGFIPNPPTYKIEVRVSDATELNSLITSIKNSSNSLVIEAVPNFISQ